jgi:hypothetical protein
LEFIENYFSELISGFMFIVLINGFTAVLEEIRDHPSAQCCWFVSFHLRKIARKKETYSQEKFSKIIHTIGRPKRKLMMVATPW